MLSDKVNLAKIETIWNEYISKGIGNTLYKATQDLNPFEKEILKLILSELETELNSED